MSAAQAAMEAIAKKKEDDRLKKEKEEREAEAARSWQEARHKQMEEAAQSIAEVFPGITVVTVEAPNSYSYDHVKLFYQGDMIAKLSITTKEVQGKFDWEQREYRSGIGWEFYRFKDHSYSGKKGWKYSSGFSEYYTEQRFGEDFAKYAMDQLPEILEGASS